VDDTYNTKYEKCIGLLRTFNFARFAVNMQHLRRMDGVTDTV